MNLTKNPFSSIAIFIVIIHGSTQQNTVNGNKIQERKCAGLSVLTVIKVVQRPSSIVQVLAHDVKYGKYALARFVHFVYICIACGNCYHFRLENCNIFRAEHNYIQNLLSLRGYISNTFQHFTAKFCNFTNFIMFSPAISFFGQYENESIAQIV